MKKINIIETTLRDGSYAINFSFTSADTSIICKQLEGVGFRYIEIGHGVGLNAANKGYGAAAASDEEYMIAAESVLKRAKYGMFCIPGIARLEDIDLAARHNMGFIRIGTDASKVPTSEHYIKRAKDHGLFVAANYMKSYILHPKELAKQVKLSEKYGADMLYIVDSAGGMFGTNIKSYFEAIRDVSNLPVGFHGHDNLGLAVANSLEAVQIGIEFIDSSLQGLGRSAGNASTEILIAALHKMGYDTGVDFLEVLKIGQKYIQPLVTTKGKMPLDIISGYAEFHSSYMHHIQKYSAKYNVDPAILIIEMCKIDKVNVDEKMLDRVARQIEKRAEVYTGEYGFDRYIGGEQDEKSRNI
jgi:4-hydroxy 2-oxovalerate aldolase/long-chain acyl-CoA synthetase